MELSDWGRRYGLCPLTRPILISSSQSRYPPAFRLAATLIGTFIVTQMIPTGGSAMKPSFFSSDKEKEKDKGGRGEDVFRLRTQPSEGIVGADQLKKLSAMLQKQDFSSTECVNCIQLGVKFISDNSHTLSDISDFVFLFTSRLYPAMKIFPNMLSELSK